MGSKAGVLKVAAARIGVPHEEYRRHIKLGEKWCHKCRGWKTKGLFCIDRSRGDGLHAVCVTCRYRRATPGPSKSERREMLARGLRWCRRCCEWLAATSVRHGVCRVHANELSRSRYANDHAFRANRRQHAHSRKRGVEPLPYEAQLLLLEEFEGKCAYCDGPAGSWDHIVPVKDGGRTTPGNVVPACIRCNSSKKDSELFSWLERMGFAPSYRLIDRLLLADAGLYG